jgi:ATP-dependent Clp protease ATP-binding subunit ClpA
MFERYTEQARRAVFFAHYEAEHQPADKISPAHLLIGLTRDAGSIADAVGSLKYNEVQLRSALGIPRPASTATNLAHKPNISLNDKSKMVLAYAAEEANLDEEHWIDTDHLLRGILRFSNEATAALQAISLDLAKARFASRRYRVEHPQKASICESASTLYIQLFGRPIRAHRILFLKFLIGLIVITFAVLLIRWLN